MKRYVLLIDFGSTFTKLTAVDLTKTTILATAKSTTTVNSNIMEGFHKALAQLKEKLPEPINFDEQLVCSSARGGFRMVAIGLTQDLTAEAAKRAALGAGTRILKSYSYRLSDEDIQEMNDLDPDIILLTGGTDGGNINFLTYNAKKLTELTSAIPIVFAGNKAAIPEVQAIFKESHLSVFYTENVMPKINLLHAEPTRNILRQIFMEKIIESKGLQDVYQLTEEPILPTPTAVLHAASLLSKGYEDEKGLGDLVVLDIGGATTDLHSIATGKPTNPSIRVEGLQEPVEKRTVEGDLGMRYSALSLYEATPTELFHYYLDTTTDLSKDLLHAACQKRSQDPWFVPTSPVDKQIDEAMAKIATDLAFSRHVGHLRQEKTPTRFIYYQNGKDLSGIKAVIGTGGVLVHSQVTESILNACQPKATELHSLKPKAPDFYVDRTYILSAMGLLGDHYPKEALQLMKKYLIHL